MRAAAPLRAGVATLVLALGGCAVFPRQPEPTTLEGEWAAQRQRFTRSGKDYDRLDDQVFVTATYQAPSVRQARADRLALGDLGSIIRAEVLWNCRDGEGNGA